MPEVHVPPASIGRDPLHASKAREQCDHLRSHRTRSARRSDPCGLEMMLQHINAKVAGRAWFEQLGGKM